MRWMCIHKPHLFTAWVTWDAQISNCKQEGCFLDWPKYRPGLSLNVKLESNQCTCLNLHTHECTNSSRSTTLGSGNYWITRPSGLGWQATHSQCDIGPGGWWKLRARQPSIFQLKNTVYKAFFFFFPVHTTLQYVQESENPWESDMSRITNSNCWNKSFLLCVFL